MKQIGISLDRIKALIQFEVMQIGVRPGALNCGSKSLIVLCTTSFRFTCWRCGAGIFAKSLRRPITDFMLDNSALSVAMLSPKTSSN
jgi:hypothetical protein